MHKTLTSGWFGIGSDHRLGLRLTICIFIIHYTTCWLWPVDEESGVALPRPVFSVADPRAQSFLIPSFIIIIMASSSISDDTMKPPRHVFSATLLNGSSPAVCTPFWHIMSFLFLFELDHNPLKWHPGNVKRLLRTVDRFIFEPLPNAHRRVG